MAKWIVPLMLGFGVALAIVVGQRMSSEAMAVVIGVAVGVAASVPTSLLLVALLRRERSLYRGEASAPPPPAIASGAQPANVIVVNPADLLKQQSAPPAYVPLPPPELAQDAGLRRLRVVGGGDDWSAGTW